MGLGIFENEGTSALKQRIEASLYTLDWGFKKIPFTLYTYVLVAKILQNGAGKSRYKKSWFQKLQEFEQLQTSSGKSKKLKFDGLFSKKIQSFS